MKRWSPTKPLRTPGAGKVRLGAAAAGVALLAAACGQAGDSVTASERVATGATASPVVSAPPRQTTTTASRTTTQITTSPAVRSTLAAPPTSGGSGEATVTTSEAAQAAPTETLPTIVPTSAPEIVTTAPGSGSGSVAGNGAGSSETTAPPAPPPANAVTIAGVNCGRHDDGDWVVFRLSNSGVTASAAYGASPVAVAGDNAVLVTFAPAIDATSGRLIATGCDYATEVVLAQNANGGVTWVIGVKGQPNLTTVAPQAVANGYAYVVKLRP